MCRTMQDRWDDRVDAMDTQVLIPVGLELGDQMLRHRQSDGSREIGDIDHHPSWEWANACKIATQTVS